MGHYTIESDGSIEDKKLVEPCIQKTISLKQELNTSRYTNSTPNIACETPPHRRLLTPSKFVFLSDQKSVPTDLKKLQERTIKRRRDHVARMHELVSNFRGERYHFLV